MHGLLCYCCMWNEVNKRGVTFKQLIIIQTTTILLSSVDGTNPTYEVRSAVI
jgi:hypothetical protein